MLAALLPLAGIATGEGDAPGAGVAAGRVLFGTYCASCHGLEGDGRGPVAAALRTPPADLTRLTERYGTPFPRARLAAFIDGRKDVAAHGPREMPVWGERFFLGDADPNLEARTRRTILVILDYLESIQRVRDAGRARSASDAG